MATNPRIPESLNPPEPGHSGGIRPEKPRAPKTGVVLVLLVAALLVGAIIYYMPRAPKTTEPTQGAEAPQQPTGEQVQLRDLQMSTAPVGGSMYIQARLNNNGKQAINGIAAQVRFRSPDGTIASIENAKVLGLKQEGQISLPEDLAKDPIKPNDSRPVRIAVDRVPQNWNHGMPDIVITGVSSHQ